MRFLTLLQSTIPSPTLDDTSPPSSTCHIFDRTIYDKFMALSQLYKSDHHFRTHYRRIYRYLHPFETIRTTVRSRFIPNCPPLKITNAFMKMYEMLEHLDKYIPSTGTLRMYDVAGAPGMFVIATERYLRETKRDTILEWHASSLVDDKDALCDLYGLYAKNPGRFEPCNVLNVDDIRRCLRKGKFDLVTGDIGIPHDDDFDHLQEERQLDIEWGQMAMALNLCDRGATMILKMYTLLTEENHVLLDTLTNHFEQVYLSKPFTSRVINDESYIICIGRNGKDCGDVPLTRPSIKSYTSVNADAIASFESSRAELKMSMVSLVLRLLKEVPTMTFRSLLTNRMYRVYYNQLARLNFLFMYLGRKKWKGKDKKDDGKGETVTETVAKNARERMVMKTRMDGGDGGEEVKLSKWAVKEVVDDLVERMDADETVE